MYGRYALRVFRVQLISALSLAAALGGDLAAPRHLQTDSGLVSFVSVTNMPGIEVSGKSGALAARAEITLNEEKLALGRIDASVQVKTLSTGMKV
jgi:hypothetical protein